MEPEGEGMNDETRLLREVVDNFMRDALLALAGAVPTPERGYLADGGLERLLVDIKELRWQHDQARKRLAKIRLIAGDLFYMETP